MCLTKENFLLNQKLIYCFWDCEINNETPFMTRGLHWKVLILKLERLLSNSTDLMFTRSCWVKIEQQTPSPDSRDNPWLDYLALPYIAPALGVNIQIASESSPPPPPASAPRQTLDLIWILWQCQVALFLSTRPTMCQSESSGCDEAAEGGHCHHTACSL